MSRGPPSNGVCSRDLVMSRASSESRISPLTASAVTRATTSLHTGPPFIVVRLVRESHVCSSPRCQVSVAGKTHFLPYSRKIDSVWPSTDVGHTGLILDKLRAQFVDVAQYLIPRQGLHVNRSAPLSTPATFLKFKSLLCCFLLDPQIIGVQMLQFAQPSSGHNGESCARISQYQSIHVCAEVFVHRDESHCFGRRSRLSRTIRLPLN